MSTTPSNMRGLPAMSVDMPVSWMRGWIAALLPTLMAWERRSWRERLFGLTKRGSASMFPAPAKPFADIKLLATVALLPSALTKTSKPKKSASCQRMQLVIVAVELLMLKISCPADVREIVVEGAVLVMTGAAGTMVIRRWRRPSR